MLVFCTKIKKWVHRGHTPSALPQDSTDGLKMVSSLWKPGLGEKAHSENYESHCLAGNWAHTHLEVHLFD